MKGDSRLSVVLDLFSRRVIGWAMAAIQDETLIETARLLALLGRHPADELLFHSDRGSQYTSDAYRAALAEVGITVSTRNMEPHRQLVRSCRNLILFRDTEG
jgi:transposase InsO family protein